MTLFFEGRFLFRIEKSLAFVYFLCYKSDSFFKDYINNLNIIKYEKDYWFSSYCCCFGRSFPD